VSRVEHEMTFAEAFRLGGVVARIRYEPGGTLHDYEVFFVCRHDGDPLVGVEEGRLRELAGAADAAGRLIDYYHGFYSVADVLEKVRDYAIEPVEHDEKAFRAKALIARKAVCS